MAKREGYIQIGVTARRDPATGEFLPAIPLFVRAEDVADEPEEQMITDFARLFAKRIREYKQKCEENGVAI